MEQIYFPQNNCPVFQWDVVALSSFAMRLYTGIFKCHESTGTLLKVIYVWDTLCQCCMHIKKVMFEVSTECFGGEKEDFAVMRNITDTETILLIKFTSVQFFYCYVFICPISVTSVLINFAIRNQDNTPIINFVSSSHLGTALYRQVLFPMLRICSY